ncbi:MAG: ATP-dependent sacrificial sulfur transferase LarE [Halobacteriota archaeon]
MTGEHDPHNTKIDEITARIRTHGSVLVAFSGGVDSSVVATLAKRALGDNAVAVTVDNGALHHGETEDADALATTIGVRHLRITINPLAIPEVKHNSPERCYHCKKLIFGTLRNLADKLGLATVMDGTNASDLDTYRPGLAALQELNVVSPLADLTKQEIRRLAYALNLPNADAPSLACLLTSFPYGSTITERRVERLRNAERALRELGIAKVKVRDHHGFARIEVDREDAKTVIVSSDTIVKTFVQLGFTYATLDLEWFRSGSMDSALNLTKSTPLHDRLAP